MRTCAKCDAPLPERVPGRPGRTRTYCGSRCKDKGRYVPTMRPPELRSEDAARASRSRWEKVPEAERSELARKTVAARWAGHTAAVKTHLAERPCRYCGDVVLMRSTQIRCPKDECRLDYNAERAGRYSHDRRARFVQATRERFVPTDVFDRDNWTCWICETPIDRTAKARTRLSASLDHVIPLSRGGDHTLDNIRCAHFGCNAARGNRVDAR